MSFVSPIVAADSVEPSKRVDDTRPLQIALGILALLTIARLSGTVDSDVAWQLWIAGRIQAGADLYRDIVETNPPLWFWMALPIERVATLLSLRIESVLIVAIGGTVALSLAATDRLLPELDAKRRSLLLSYAAATVFAMPWAHVGQREQIVMIATLPYAALIAARRDLQPVSAILAVGVGIGAGLGFALKHYFLIVPVLLEAWLLASSLRRWRPLRPETVAIGGVGLVYAAAILAERDYVELIVPLLGQAYGIFSAPGFLYLLGPFAAVGLVLIAVLLAAQKAVRGIPLVQALLIASIGFAAAYFIQFKGWTYHAIPMLGCSAIALASVLAYSTETLRLLRLGAPALLCLPLSLSAAEAANPSLPSRDLKQAVAGLPAGVPVAFISEDTAIAWSITLQHGWRYPSRYNGFWMLRALLLNEKAEQPDPALIELGRRVTAQTVADFRCLPPRRIVAQPEPLAYFMRDPAFVHLLTHYALVSRIGFLVYEQRSALEAPGGDCVRGR